MRVRIPGLPVLNPGDRIHLTILRIDELMQEIEFRFSRGGPCGGSAGGKRGR
nr:hypothetical protein [Paludibacterium denitrificans]